MGCKGIYEKITVFCVGLAGGGGDALWRTAEWREELLSILAECEGVPAEK